MKWFVIFFQVSYLTVPSRRLCGVIWQLGNHGLEKGRVKPMCWWSLSIGLLLTIHWPSNQYPTCSFGGLPLPLPPQRRGRASIPQPCWCCPIWREGWKSLGWGRIADNPEKDSIPDYATSSQLSLVTYFIDIDEPAAGGGQILSIPDLIQCHVPAALGWFKLGLDPEVSKCLPQHMPSRREYT